MPRVDHGSHFGELEVDRLMIDDRLAEGTTNRSMAAMSGAWLCKKIRHPWLRGPRRLTMYLATLDRATSTHKQLAVDAWRTPTRMLYAHPPDQRAQLRVDLRSTSQWARLPTPVAANAGSVPTHERLGPDDCENLQD
jgi:hypothetical protein